MKDAILAEMHGILEMTRSTGIVAIPALGAVRSMPEAEPPAAQHQDPQVDQAIIKLADSLEGVMQSTQLELRSIFNKVKTLKATAPMRHDLEAMMHIVKQTHDLLGELRTMAREDFRQGTASNAH